MNKCEKIIIIQMSPASFILHIYHGSHKICGEKYICGTLKSNSLRNMMKI